ncbi:hypothetical protein [Chitinibacter sp. GC72]|uniref:hypothetical protein n=1 Tax=Chitinibacter sp. GC72 TaxID=1526917 RepID=UPI0012FB3C3C|nr:hypothetical protein [Chitinibacter sp. GC72]
MRKQRHQGSRLLAWLEQHGRHPAAIPALAALSVGDYFFPALPGQSSVIVLSLLQARRQTAIVLAFAIAAAIGAILLIALSSGVLAMLAQLPLSLPATPLWLTGQQLLQTHGILALAVLSIWPAPPRSLIVLGVMSGLNEAAIVLAVLIGKLIWFSALTTLIIKAPARLLRLPFVGKKLARWIANPDTRIEQ